MNLAHPTIARAAFNDPAWLFEVKHDGFRALASKAGEQIEIRSRSGRKLGPAFPELVGALRTLPDATLDGELVVPTAEGRSDFEELRRRALLTRDVSIADASRRRPAVLVIFDVLEARGHDMRDGPLSLRKAWLQDSVEARPGIQVAQGVMEHGIELFAAVCQHDGEGIVAKRLNAPYRAGRSRTWLKIKNKAYSRQAAVVWQG